MGTHLRVLSESYVMNTNMSGFRWFLKKTLHLCTLSEKSMGPCGLEEKSFSIARVKQRGVHQNKWSFLEMFHRGSCG